MKKGRSMAVGLACAAACALCVGAFMAQVGEQAERARAEALDRYGGDQLEVCVARRDIASGEVVDEGAVETRLWVADLLPEGAITARADVVGKQASAAILKGEALTSRRFGSAAAPSLDVPAGLVAVSVPAREVQAVGGALQAGMRADVYATGAQATELLVPRALVLATSTDSSGLLAAGAVEWVTLAVAPSAAQELVAAAQGLDIYFVLPADSGGDPPDSPDPPAPEGREDRIAAAWGTATAPQAAGEQDDL